MIARSSRYARWRVSDLVVVAVLGASFGVVYWAWNQLWLLTAPLFVVFPPAQAVLYGVWMLPAVLAGYLIRRPGAAVLGSITATVVSAFLGNVFGLTVLIYGLVQGVAAESVFAGTRYRVWNWFTAGLATGFAAACGTTLDVTLYYPFWTLSEKLTYVGLGAAGAFALGAWLVPLLTRRMAAAGVLDSLPSGRSAPIVDASAASTDAGTAPAGPASGLRP